MKSIFRKEICWDHLIRQRQGFSMPEMLVSVVLSSVLLATVAGEFLHSGRRTFDQSIATETEEEARALLDLLVYDVRLLGAGMPISQSDFSDIGTGIGEKALPILLSSDNDTLSIRLNEQGLHTVITTTFTPTTSTRDFDVLSPSGLAIDDTVYISDLYAGGSGGLVGIIQALTGNTVTLEASFETPAGSTFNPGSAVHKVSTVTFESPGDGSGITRDDGNGAVVLTPRSTFSVTYLDSSGAPLTIPLTDVVVVNDLAAILLNVSVSGRSRLRDGRTYTSSASQTVALRNLIYAR